MQVFSRSVSEQSEEIVDYTAICGSRSDGKANGFAGMNGNMRQHETFPIKIVGLSGKIRLYIDFPLKSTREFPEETLIWVQNHRF